jgi:hypothetical protein
MNKPRCISSVPIKNQARIGVIFQALAHLLAVTKHGEPNESRTR